jgi:hypothetical protein
MPFVARDDFRVVNTDRRLLMSRKTFDQATFESPFAALDAASSWDSRVCKQVQGVLVIPASATVLRQNLL